MTYIKALTASLLLTAFPLSALAQIEATPAAQAPAQAPMIIAKVNGLVCDFCAQALKKVFKKEAAVQDLSVDLDAGEVLITLKDGQTLPEETVKKLIRKSGYSLVSTRRMGGA